VKGHGVDESPGNPGSPGNLWYHRRHLARDAVAIEQLARSINEVIVLCACRLVNHM
jgi:hypothetical protein